MAATKTRLKAELAKALRAKDEFTKSTIRMMLAAITVEEVAGKVARELAKKMSTAWVNFAKTGNPNGGDLPQWDAYTRENGNVMILITKSRLNNITMRSYSAYWLRK